jgi:hypothetical protein
MFFLFMMMAVIVIVAVFLAVVRLRLVAVGTCAAFLTAKREIKYYKMSSITLPKSHQELFGKETYWK